MLKLEEALGLDYKIVVWGTGNCFKKHIECVKKHIPIEYVTDSDNFSTNKNTYNLSYKNIYDVTGNVYVIIMVENKGAIKEISERLESLQIPYCFVEDALGFCTIREEQIYVEEHSDEFSQDDNKWNGVLKKYICINVPATTCNLACPYCYIRHTDEFYKPPILYHSPKYIRMCLSQKRLNGQALVVLCGSGETLLADKIIDICIELLQEGHFLHIVTNGTLTNKIVELMERAGKYGSHLFFKFSFHYGELKRQNKLETFAQNVNYVSEKGASFTVELTTDDNLLGEINEVKKFSLEKFGALPHITIARDDTKKEIPIYTKLSHEEYYRIWSQFESKLFEVKWKYFGKFINNCSAGKTVLYVSLQTGNIKRCLGQPTVGNIYEKEEQLLEYQQVKNKCVFPYCYNNHAYLTLGVSPDIETYSYAKVRDRERVDGTHWVKEELYNFINQKLYETNDIFN